MSTDPAYAPHCRTAAEHVAADLRSLGFETSVRPTEGHPVVVGKSGNGGANGHGPRVLFYGHYDVQPVDPLDLWKTPPFEPRIETLDGGRKIIVARGACDDKGQAMTFVEACRAFKAVTGKLPLDITMMIEGEEECGSKHLFGFVRDNAAEFKRDLALVCDTGMWDAQTPSITTSLRGLVYEEVRLTCADRDLHSGLFGGAARNPIHVLADILSAMHKPDGSVAIPGFYDGVHELPRRHQGRSRGPRPHAGEIPRPDRAENSGRRKGPHADRADFHAADRRGQRHHRRLYRGGRQDRHSRQGDGQSLVPPGRRAGPGKNPRRLPRFRPRARAGRLLGRVRQFQLALPAFDVAFDNPALGKARTALAEEWGKKAVTIGAGGSIPIVGDFKTVLGMDTLMVGFALDDDRVHSPNEKFDLKCFHKGIRSWARILAALAA